MKTKSSNKKPFWAKSTAAILIAMLLMVALPAASVFASTTAATKPTANTSFGTTNPANAYDANTSTFASFTASSNYSTYQTFGFSIPAGSTINSVTVTLNAAQNVSTGARQVAVSVSTNGGTTLSGTQTTAITSTTAANYTYTGASTLWGLTSANLLTALNNNQFAVDIQAQTGTGSGARNFNLYNLTVTVDYTAPTYTVTFNSNFPFVAGGSGSMSNQTFTGGVSQALTANAFADTGYTFAGWATSAGGAVVYTDGQSIAIGANTTLYAKWTANTNTVTFNSNFPYVAGGSGSMSTESFTSGSAKALTTNAFADTGYTFAGWGTSVGGPVVYTNAQSITIYSNTTLYAQWTANTNTVTFNGNGNDGGSMSTESFTSGSAKALTTNGFTNTGYTFAGWATTAGGAVAYTDGQSITIYSSTTLYAKWTINQYTITFDSNGGSAVASITQDYNSTVTAPADPTKAGYTFAGWSPAVPATMPLGGAALTAQWTVNQYTITFDSNGGSAVASITQDYNSTVTAPADPTKAGYTFAGWSPAVPATMPLGGAALTAQWTINQYTITFDSNGGSAVASITQDYNSTVTAPADPTKAGYTFAGWSPAVPATMPLGGAALTAQWTVNQYTITFDSNGGSAVASITQDYNSAVTAPADPTKAGYTFAGWSPAVPATMPLGGAALTAQWTVNQYTITFDSNGGSVVASITQDYGSAVTAPADPTKAGYTFAGWSPAVPATMPLGGAALTAQWTVNQYTITFDSNGGSVVASITQDYGSAVTAPADPTKAGYTFAGWSPAVPATMPLGGAALTAQWTINQYTITFDSNGGSAVASITQDYGSAVTAPADPTKAGYTFAGWSPAVPATMPLGGAALTAQWTVNQYTITFDSNGGSAVASITQDYNSTVTAPADPTKAGYTFAGWSPAVPATMPLGGAALTAQWTINQYTITFDSNGGSAVASITQDYNSTVTAPADPTKAGYTFAGWSPAVPATMPLGGAALTAQWTVNQYTITFDSNGGSAVASITQDYNSAVTAPADPTKAGYTFAGWSPAVPATMPLGGAALTAQWTVNQYTITFDSNGGSVVASITQDYGSAVTAPADPTKAGYTFAGWSPAVPATMPLGGAALTAQWTVNQYTITFDSNGGSAVASITQDYNSTVTAPADPTKASFTFAGWYSDAGLTTAYTFTTMPASDITLFAKWTVNPNIAPVITEGASVGVNMSQDGNPTPFNLTLNATDANGDPITWSISTQAGHGTASASGTGSSKSIGYTPALNYIGSDSFIVQVSDGNGGTDTITVNVTITAVQPTTFTIYLPLVLR